MGEELVVRVTVGGTTFDGVYEVDGTRLLLTSSEFGEISAHLGGRSPEAVAELLLRSMAEKGVQATDIPFLKDDGG